MNQPLNYYPLSFIHPRRQTPQFIIQFLFVGAGRRATAKIGEMTKEEELRPRVCCGASKRCAKLRHVRLESLCCKCGGAADGQRRRIAELLSTIRDTFFSVFFLFSVFLVPLFFFSLLKQCCQSLPPYIHKVFFPQISTENRVTKSMEVYNLVRESHCCKV